jgi:hypothetical protein
MSIVFVDGIKRFVKYINCFYSSPNNSSWITVAKAVLGYHNKKVHRVYIIL